MEFDVIVTFLLVIEANTMLAYNYQYRNSLIALCCCLNFQISRISIIHYRSLLNQFISVLLPLVISGFFIIRLA